MGFCSHSGEVAGFRKCLGKVREDGLVLERNKTPNYGLKVMKEINDENKIATKSAGTRCFSFYISNNMGMSEHSRKFLMKDA